MIKTREEYMEQFTAEIRMKNGKAINGNESIPLYSLDSRVLKKTCSPSKARLNPGPTNNAKTTGILAASRNINIQKYANDIG